MGGMMEKEINGEILTQDTVIEKHKGLVHRECNRITRLAKSLGHEYDDIYQVGCMGLLKAFENFDYEKFPVRFSTYATPMIYGELSRMLRDSNVGVKYSRNVKELAWLIRKDDKKDLSVDELAAEYGVKKSLVVYALDFLVNRYAKDLEEPLFVTEGTPVTISDVVGNPDDVTELFVKDFIESLPEQERVIIEGVMSGRSQADSGKMVGVSQVQVSRIIQRVGKKYINYLAGKDVNTKDKPKPKESVKKMPKKLPFTEADVIKLREQGLTYAAIAQRFGITYQTLKTRRQNWDLEKVRNANNPQVDPVEDNVIVEPERNEELWEKDQIINEQRAMIEQLVKEKEGLTQSEPLRKEPSDRKLLIMLLEREVSRLKMEA